MQEYRQASQRLTSGLLAVLSSSISVQVYSGGVAAGSKKLVGGLRRREFFFFRFKALKVSLHLITCTLLPTCQSYYFKLLELTMQLLLP